jgi:hypothetical protein
LHVTDALEAWKKSKIEKRSGPRKKTSNFCLKVFIGMGMEVCLFGLNTFRV